MEKFRRNRDRTPQILDVINPGALSEAKSHDRREFRYLFINTQATLEFLGKPPPDGWMTFVIPHHHCNSSGFRLPEERLERPKVVGYVGDPDHLHDADEIRSVVERLGMRWLSADSWDLGAYKEIDIGVAWTRPQGDRDATRSNIKFANLAAHGIPCAVCDYQSYRDVDKALGGGSGMICPTLSDLLTGISELATDSELRRSIATKALGAYETYSLPAIADSYRQAIREARTDFGAPQ